MIDNKKRKKWEKISGIFVSLLLILFGLASILRGEWNYPNYWGGVVFAPLAILVGLCVIIIILFKWKKLDNYTMKQNSEMDDYKKW